MNSKLNLNRHHHARFPDGLLESLGQPLCNNPATSQNAAQLRETLSIMFPHSYIRLYHLPPHSMCSLFNFKEISRADSRVAASGRDNADHRNHLEKGGTEQGDNLLIHSTPMDVCLKPSSEPSSRIQVLRLQNQFEKSLVEHGARPIGLCPVRRAIYDQCFDEIIRQVTVGCIERGLLLFKLRNEFRMTISCYRRLYESAVGYHLGKHFEAKVQQACADVHRKTIDKSNETRNVIESGPDLVASNERSLSRLEEYYKGELAKREEIIRQQRAVMRALNAEPNKVST